MTTRDQQLLAPTTFSQFAAFMQSGGTPLDPRKADVLRGMSWGPFKPSLNAWLTAHNALQLAEFNALDRSKPNVYKTRSGRCDVFHVRSWKRDRSATQG